MSGGADDDGDEIAIDDGMEPESPDGSDPGAGDDGDPDDGDDLDDDGAVAAGGPISRTMNAPGGTRAISAKTRELGKAIAAKLKGKGDAADPDLPDDDDLDYDEGATTTPGSAAAPAPVTDPGAAPAADPAPVAPPAATLDPEVTRLREEWGAKSKELEAREAKLLEQERSGDLAQLAERYFEQGAPAIVDLLKKWEGADGDALKDAIADLVSDLTIHMGVEVPQEIKDRLETKRTRKQVQRLRSEQTRKEQEAAERAKTTQDEQNRVRVKGILQQEINKPENAPTYPWLTAEPNAGEIVFDVIDAQYMKDGTRLSWQEAAKRANDFLKTQGSAYFDKRRHLFTTAAAGGAGGQQQQQRTQADPQVRRSQAQQPAKPPTPPPEPAPSGKWDAEAHRRETKRKHGPALRKAFSQPDE